MNPKDMRNHLLAKKVIAGLKKRNMTGYYVQTIEEAKLLLIDMIDEKSTVANGGSYSIDATGIKEYLRDGNFNFIEKTPSTSPCDALRISRESFFADYYLCSTNAISEDGILVNIDGNSNRVAAIAFGPSKVIMVVGMNKITSDEKAALDRARTIAAPINGQRFDITTPCKKTGSCIDCTSIDTICCQFLVTRFSKHLDRIHIILVNEDLGF